MKKCDRIVTLTRTTYVAQASHELITKDIASNITANSCRIERRQIMAVNGRIMVTFTAKGEERMPRLDLGNPYDYYVQTLIDTGLYSTYTEVVKDALRQHMNSHAESKRIALFHATIAEGEADIQAGRVELYNPELIDRLTSEVLADE